MRKDVTRLFQVAHALPDRMRLRRQGGFSQRMAKYYAASISELEHIHLIARNTRIGIIFVILTVFLML